jgi:hypothetical protein
LKRKSLLILATVVALSVVMLVSAASYLTFTFNMTGTIAEGGTVTVTIGTTTYNTGQSLDINWNTIAAGNVVPVQTYTQSITIHNNVNNAVTPGIATTLSSTYGTITLSSTTAIPANGQTTVNVVFTVSSTAPAGAIPAWTATLTAASA